MPANLGTFTISPHTDAELGTNKILFQGKVRQAHKVIYTAAVSPASFHIFQANIGDRHFTEAA
jgi:hypothetical protein